MLCSYVYYCPSTSLVVVLPSWSGATAPFAELESGLLDTWSIPTRVALPLARVAAHERPIDLA